MRSSGYIATPPPDVVEAKNSLTQMGGKRGVGNSRLEPGWTKQEDLVSSVAPPSRQSKAICLDVHYCL